MPLCFGYRLTSRLFWLVGSSFLAAAGTLQGRDETSIGRRRSGAIDYVYLCLTVLLYFWFLSFSSRLKFMNYKCLDEPHAMPEEMQSAIFGLKIIKSVINEEKRLRKKSVSMGCRKSDALKPALSNPVRWAIRRFR